MQEASLMKELTVRLLNSKLSSVDIEGSSRDYEYLLATPQIMQYGGNDSSDDEATSSSVGNDKPNGAAEIAHARARRWIFLQPLRRARDRTS